MRLRAHKFSFKNCHGLPGTPVGDLFPPGVVAAGRKPAIPQAMSPRGRDYPPPREGARTPFQVRGYGNNPHPLEPVDVAIRMASNFLLVRQGDEEAAAARVTYEVSESTAAAVRESQHRQECESAVR